MQCYSVSMRIFVLILFILLCGTSAQAQVNSGSTLTQNLSLGSRSAQVIALQKILNKDPDTHIAETGPGSPGKETSYFGLLTKAAVIRFQMKYASEVLTPAGLTKANGRVVSYTRTKLNTLSVIPKEKVIATVPPVATSTVEIIPVATTTDYIVKENEKIDIYAGDKMIANVQSKLLTAINSIITSQSSGSSAMPTIAPTELPSTVIRTLSPQYGIPGTKVSVEGLDISMTSVIRFGGNYIVRKIQSGPSGDFFFEIPTIPPGYYDLAIQTNASISSTLAFVVTDPKNPLVHIQSISPTAVSYGGTITITGSGFSPQGNTVVTNYQKFTSVPSSDGKTITITLAPERLREAARAGTKKRIMNMVLYVVNEYGFSDSKKTFTMAL